MRRVWAVMFVLAGCSGDSLTEEGSTAGCPTGQIYLHSVDGCAQSCVDGTTCGLAETCSKPNTACYPDPRCPDGASQPCPYPCVGVCQAAACATSAECPQIVCIAAPCPRNECLTGHCTLISPHP